MRHKKTATPFVAVMAVSMASLLFFSSFGVLYVREASMEPLLHEGTIVLVRKGRSGTPRRGDLWIFADPIRGELVVKRCLLVAGDPIAIVNGKLLTTRGSLPLTRAQKAWIQLYPRVPPGALFMVGDNREKSVDSRDYGFVTTEKLQGKVLFALEGRALP